MKLSVVIPCYNAAATLGEQLEALAEQRWDQAWEVVLADNRSTDGSMAIAASFASRLPNLRVVDASLRQGQPFALNAGAEAAHGDALAFCDADDVVGKGWVAAMGHALAHHEFVACRTDIAMLNSPAVQRTRRNAQGHGLQAYTNPPFLPHAGGGTLGVRRALHDTDYCWRLQESGVRLTFVPEALTHVRYRDTARGNYLQAKSYGEYNVLLYRRYRHHGMPPVDWRRGVKGWLTLAMGIPLLYRPQARLLWMRRLGWRMGRLQGSLKHRVFAL
ncbi:MAG: glycosyltransferase family 2 protein [bacterium]|nr:glycosyltransferase family 2 protein [bacterium]